MTNPYRLFDERSLLRERKVQKRTCTEFQTAL